MDMDLVELDHFRLIKEPEVLRLTGLSRSRLHRMVDSGEFPPPVSTGPRSVAWRVRDVLAWLESRPPARDTPWESPSCPVAGCPRQSGGEQRGSGLSPARRG